MLILIAFCLLLGVFLARYKALILLPATFGCIVLVVCWAQLQGVSFGFVAILALLAATCLQASYFLAFYCSLSLPWRSNRWMPPALGMSAQLPAARAFERSDRD
jgi:hypothetical protein